MESRNDFQGFGIVSERIERIGASVIVYDDDLVDRMDESVFATRSQGEEIQASNDLAGRGNTLVISVEGRPCVRRHYYRGGRIRRVSEDAFIWMGQGRTRSFLEWRLLAILRCRDLPVPRPIAARYLHGGLFYTADLITEQLPDVQSLAARLASASLSDDLWRRVGTMVADFHAAHVFHADLTAHNIQLGDNGRLYLLDFDRGRIMSGTGAWAKRNLQRLQRSLQKISRQDGAHFSSGDWLALLEGYRTRPAR